MIVFLAFLFELFKWPACFPSLKKRQQLITTMIIRTTIKTIPAVLAKVAPTPVGQGGSVLNVSSGLFFMPSVSNRQISLSRLMMTWCFH